MCLIWTALLLVKRLNGHKLRSKMSKMFANDLPWLYRKTTVSRKNIPLSLIKQTLFNQLDPKISMINMLNYKSIFVINYLMTSDVLFGHFDQLTLIRYVLYYISIYINIKFSLTYLPKNLTSYVNAPLHSSLQKRYIDLSMHLQLKMIT